MFQLQIRLFCALPSIRVTKQRGKHAFMADCVRQLIGRRENMLEAMSPRVMFHSEDNKSSSSVL